METNDREVTYIGGVGIGIAADRACDRRSFPFVQRWDGTAPPSKPRSDPRDHHVRRSGARGALESAPIPLAMKLAHNRAAAPVTTGAAMLRTRVMAIAAWLNRSRELARKS